jgi:hypothetical protein
LAALFLWVGSVQAAADDAAVPGTFELSTGVVINLGNNQAYVMTPDEHIAAISIDHGNQIWRSSAPAKPLAISNNVLVSQVAPSAARPNQLNLVGLSTKESGKPVFAKNVALPPGVRASISRTYDSLFEASASPQLGGANVTWEYSATPRGGIRPGGPESIVGNPDGGGVTPPTAHAPTEVGELSNKLKGAFRVNFTSRSIVPLQPNTVSPPIAHPPQSTTASNLPAIPEPQFPSADGRYILSSERITSDTAVWDKYLWTVYDASNHERVGQIKSHLRVAPFFVLDSKIIYEDGPYSRRSDNGQIVSEPRQLRAVNLTTSELTWSQPLRETGVPGPVPP